VRSYPYKTEHYAFSDTLALFRYLLRFVFLYQQFVAYVPLLRYICYVSSMTIYCMFQTGLFHISNLLNFAESKLDLNEIPSTDYRPKMLKSKF